jgi:8-oxo-dGTP pyrophosphatase MutT (NUDIX family)
MPQDIRHVARVLLINDQGQTFLLRGRDPGAPERAPFWFTPGGKIDDGETPQEAAARELFEEVGVTVSPETLGDVIGTEDSAYSFEGIAYRQHGVFFAHYTNVAGLNASGWTEIEARTIDQGKWWSLEDIRATQETIYPAHLAEMLTGLA